MFGGMFRAVKPQGLRPGGGRQFAQGRPGGPKGGSQETREMPSEKKPGKGKKEKRPKKSNKNVKQQSEAKERLEAKEQQQFEGKDRGEKKLRDPQEPRASEQAADSRAKRPGKKKKSKTKSGDGSEAPATIQTETPQSGISRKGNGKKRRLERDGTNNQKDRTLASAPKAVFSLVAPAGKTSVGKAAARLKGSRFRWLNEQLYTTTGAEALSMYKKDPSLVEAYHEGFRAQAAKWPRNPLDDVIAWLREFPPEIAIGDFGCGDARLALELSNKTVHSFDLLAVNDRVTPCNLASVPIPDTSIDVAVFCLALMGTDWPEFLAEAHRCLRPDGLCHIVEVESRFSDVDSVIKRIEAIGFKKVLFKPSSFFLELRFVRLRAGKEGKKSKVGAAARNDSKSENLLGACTYRRR